MTSSLARGSLVLHKHKPAVVLQNGEKLEIQCADRKTISVRPKDLALLHPGPADLQTLRAPAGDLLAAWELLAGSTTTLRDLAELAFGTYTPASAWAAWQWVADGVYFSGSVEHIVAHAAQYVEQEQESRAARAGENQAWSAFLDRMRSRRFEPQDQRYLVEVEQLAYGRREKSRVLMELGREQSPSGAHALLLELGVWNSAVNPYPERLHVALHAASADLPALPAEARRDLTHLPAFAIDDEGSHDPDDAISLDGDCVWVHIADVAALVAPDSEADLEARSRGATLYLPEQVIGMLPAQATEQLGLGLASVSPALSFGFRVAADGSLSELEIVPSTVRVTRLSYEQADARLGEEPLRTLYRLAAIHRERRQQHGAVLIDLPEVRLKVTDGIVAITTLPSLRSRAIVSELMLMAGAVVAEWAIAHAVPLPFIIQEAGDLIDPPQTVSEMAAARRQLRPSQTSITPGPHAGLGLPTYTRITSPLRRYNDLLGHQQLRLWLAKQPTFTEQQLIERIGEVEAAATAVRRAESHSRQHWTLVYLQQHAGWRGSGIVIDKMGLRVVVLIPALAWETRVHLRKELPVDSVLEMVFVEANLPLLDAYFKVRS